MESSAQRELAAPSKEAVKEDFTDPVSDQAQTLDPEVVDEEEEGEDEEMDESIPCSASGEHGKTANRRMQSGIKYITDKSKRHITFSKRKSGIMKKVTEFAVLTGAQIIVAIASEASVYLLSTPKLTAFAKGDEFRNRLTELLYHYGPSVCDAIEPSAVNVDKFQFRVQSRCCYYGGQEEEKQPGKCRTCGETPSTNSSRQRNDNSSSKKPTKGLDSKSNAKSTARSSSGSAVSESVEKVPYAATQYVSYTGGSSDGLNVNSTSGLLNASARESQPPSKRYSDQARIFNGSPSNSMAPAMHAFNMPTSLPVLQTPHVAVSSQAPTYPGSGDKYYGFRNSDQAVYNVSTSSTSFPMGAAQVKPGEMSFYGQEAQGVEGYSQTSTRYLQQSAGRPVVTPQVRHAAYAPQKDTMDSSFGHRMTAGEQAYYGVPEMPSLVNQYNGFSVHVQNHPHGLVVYPPSFGPNALDADGPLGQTRGSQQPHHMPLRPQLQQHQVQQLHQENSQLSNHDQRHVLLGQPVTSSQSRDAYSSSVASQSHPAGRQGSAQQFVHVDPSLERESEPQLHSRPLHHSPSAVNSVDPVTFPTCLNSTSHVANEIASSIPASSEIQKPYKTISSMIFESQ